MTGLELAAGVSLEISIWTDIRIRVQESSTSFRSIHLIFPFYYYISTMQPTGLGTFVLTSASTLSTLRGPQLITPTGDFSNLTWTSPTPPTSPASPTVPPMIIKIIIDQIHITTICKKIWLPYVRTH